MNKAVETFNNYVGRFQEKVLVLVESGFGCLLCGKSGLVPDRTYGTNSNLAPSG